MTPSQRNRIMRAILPGVVAAARYRGADVADVWLQWLLPECDEREILAALQCIEAVELHWRN